MNKTCETCGMGFYVRPSHAPIRFTCSRKCNSVRVKKLGVFSGANNSAFGKTYCTKELNPDWALKISKTSKGKINLGESNGMKKPESRKRLSEVALNRSAELRRKIGDGVSHAWQNGKFDGVRTGRCKWYNFVGSDGAVYKVQGAWELAFAYWLDQKGMKFKAHRKYVRYIDANGVKRAWYPDFYVEEWCAWVDVKADYFHNPEKFDRIRQCNPQLKIRILLAGDLKALGIEIYRPGGVYMPYLQELVDRCRVYGQKELFV